MNSIETTVSYALVKYGVFLPIALTEIKFRITNSSSATPPSLLYHTSCTFPLLVNTFALFKYPDKMIGRILANRKVNKFLKIESHSKLSMHRKILVLMVSLFFV